MRNRILKRPMFRMGGMSNQGIMSGIRPRQNYAETGVVKDYYGDAEKIIIEELKKAKPNYSIISEENGTENNKDKTKEHQKK